MQISKTVTPFKHEAFKGTNCVLSDEHTLASDLLLITSSCTFSIQIQLGSKRK